jgi:hypothetical protein
MYHDLQAAFERRMAWRKANGFDPVCVSGDLRLYAGHGLKLSWLRTDLLMLPAHV